MDLNFLVFPKPSFKCPNDAFYSRLLFVPKQQRQIKNLVLKKASMLNKSSDRGSMNSDGEGTANLPYSMARQSFDFSKFKGRTMPVFHKPTVKTNSECDLEEAEEDEDKKQEVRAVEKKVRLPRSRNTTSIIKVLGSGAKEKPLPVQPLSRIAEIRKLTVQSSRFTSNHSRQGQGNHVTLSKLMNDLDNFKKNRPSDVKLISQLEKKFNNSGSRGTFIDQSKPFVKDDKSLELEFEAPNERPTLINDKLGSFLQYTSPPKVGPMRIFPQRSLHQLKGKVEASGSNSDDGQPTPFQRFGSRNLLRFAKDKSRSTNSSVNLGNQDPLEEVGRLQSPQHIMLKYNDVRSNTNKLGEMFAKRRIDQKSKALFSVEGLGSRTEAQMNIRLRPENEATKNKNLLDNPLNENETIPCLLIKPDFPSDIVLLYFHANGEDIQQCQYFCELLKSSLNVAPVNPVLGGRRRVSGLQCLQGQRDLGRADHQGQ